MHSAIGRRALATVLMLMSLSECLAETAPQAALTVRASGFADSGGHAVAKLFRPGDNVLEHGRWESRVAIHDGLAVMRFPALTAGTYALVVFHDRNDDGRINHGLLGPSEALGFSGGFVLSLFSGRPTFDELKFEFNGQATTLEVSVR